MVANKDGGLVKVTDHAAGNAPRHSSSFENILRLRASLATEDRHPSTSTHPAHEERSYDASIEREPSGLRARTMYRRDKDRHALHDGTASVAYQTAQETLQASQFLHGLLEWVYLGFYGALHVPVPGYGGGPADESLSAHVRHFGGACNRIHRWAAAARLE